MKLNLEAESLRSKRTERIELYAAFHSAYHTYFVVATSSMERHEEPGRTIYNQALSTLRDLADRICMMASNSVSDPILQMIVATDEYVDKEKEERGSADVTEVNTSRARLMTAIRKDIELHS